MKINSLDSQSIELLNLTHAELFAILKTNISVLIKFKNNRTKEDEKFYSIRLSQRIVGKDAKQKVLACHNTFSDENYEKFVLNEDVEFEPYYQLSYNDLLKMINENREKTGGDLVLEVWKREFKEKEPLLMILGDIKPEIVESCVYLDYSNNVFHLVNLPHKNGDTDALYYFEQNNSMLIFSDNGPNLLASPKINSIEDLICK